MAFVLNGSQGVGARVLDLAAAPVDAAIGLGMIGKVHTKFASQIDECELVAVCDVDSSKEKMARDLETKYYNNY